MREVREIENDPEKGHTVVGSRYHVPERTNGTPWEGRSTSVVNLILSWKDQNIIYLVSRTAKAIGRLICTISEKHVPMPDGIS